MIALHESQHGHVGSRSRPSSSRGLGIALMLLAATLAAPAAAQKAPVADPEKIAAAKQLIEAQGGIAQARKGLDQMRAAMIAEVGRRSPGEVQALTRFMDTYVDGKSPKITALFSKVQEASVQFYAERCTVDEMKAMTAFLGSPTGKKFVEVAPEAASIVAPHLIQFQQELIAEVRAAAQRGDFQKKP